MKKPDTIVVGAGAAGIFAATRAGERGRQVLLVEKNRKLGVKILMSGGTRCNITQNTDNRGIVEAFGRSGRFLHSALSHLSPADVVNWVEGEGVSTKIESTGKIFPASDRAIDVRNALVKRMRRSGNVQILNPCPVTSIQKLDSGMFEVAGNFGESDRRWQSKTIVLTTGGRSYPGCGTTGDGYHWAEQMGHTIVDPVPALTPIVAPDQWVRDLTGLTVDACLGVFRNEDLSRLSDQNFRKLAVAYRQNSLLFTHFGFSGPAALDVSKAISRGDPKSLKMVVDFLPNESSDRLIQSLASAETQRNNIGKWATHNLPQRLTDSLLNQCGVDPKKRIGEMALKQQRQVVEQLKRCPVQIEGTRGFKKAEVTAGGIDLREVNSKTMESKICQGFYLAGEILDLDGLIGGYNFQSAFSTGHLAGMNA